MSLHPNLGTGPTPWGAPTPAPPTPDNDNGWWWGAVGIVAFLALIGLASPRLALRAALFVALALGALAALQAIVRYCQQVPARQNDSFASSKPAISPPDIPAHIEWLRTAGGPDVPLSVGTYLAIATVGTERLWARHRLNLHDPAHQPYIQRIVSPELWSAFAALSKQTYPARNADLPRLLDELDQL